MDIVNRVFHGPLPQPAYLKTFLVLLWHSNVANSHIKLLLQSLNNVHILCACALCIRN